MQRSPSHSRPLPMTLGAVARLCLAACLCAGLACTENSVGQGIGRPVVPESTYERGDRFPLSIRRVKATGDPSEHFVVLQNDGSEPVALQGLSLCDRSCDCDAGCDGTRNRVAIATSADPTLQGGERRVLGPDGTAVDSLALRATAGEVAIVDADDTLHAYLAWGGDPTVLSEGLHVLAVLRQATAVGDHVPVPYPPPADAVVTAETETMKDCYVPTGGADAPDYGAAPHPDREAPCEPPDAPPLALNEVRPLGLGDDATLGDSWVEIRNMTADELPLYGVRICALPACAVLGRSDTAPADSLLVVSLGGTPPQVPTDVVVIALPDARAVPAVGDVAIVAPGDAAVAEMSILSFAGYGSNEGALTAQATDPEQSRWSTEDGPAVAPRATGESLSRVENGEDRGHGWKPVRTPSPGEENRCGDDTAFATTWCSCSAPDPATDYEPLELTLTHIGRVDGTADGPLALVLANRSPDGNAVALTHWFLALDGNDPLELSWTPDDEATAAAHPAIEQLAAGTLLAVQLAVEQTHDDCPPGLRCWPQESLPSSGSLRLLYCDPDAGCSSPAEGRIRQYVQWGDDPGCASDPSSQQCALVADAVAAGLWPLDGCALASLGESDLLELSDEAEGRSPADYRHTTLTSDDSR